MDLVLIANEYLDGNPKVICKLDIENDYDRVKCECLMYDWEVWL